MADNSSHKTQKLGEKNKYTNMINRTTSESIRLSDSDKTPIHPTTLSATSNIPRKKTSFQITSVTVGGHTSNDGGDDSADDLDESHAEDISDVIDTSRATDIENETPSYSEDTFSKDDLFFNSSTSLGSAPVIPTSSQYGLALVSTPEGCGNNILNSNVPGDSNSSGNDLHVNVSDSNVINLGIVGGKHLEGEMRDLHSHTSRNERFKVVKIESTEPFKRGRWMCMDYLDHSMLQHQHNQQIQNQGSTTNVNRVVDSNDVSAISLGTGADSGISMSDHPVSTLTTIDEHLSHSDHGISIGSSITNSHDQQNLAPHSIALTTGQNSVSPGQTMQFSNQGNNVVHTSMTASQPQPLQQQAQSLTTVTSQHSPHNVNQHQSLQPQQMQQVLSGAIHGQQASISNQQIQQPMQQMQHQGIPVQHVHQIHQPQTAPNMVPQQSYQQPLPQIQQIHHQQAPLQPVQQNTQGVLQQQSTLHQHIQQQPVTHQHNVSMPVQQQLSQTQIPGQIAQNIIQQNQSNIQQIPQQNTQIPVHPQMQQMQSSQHVQHVTVQQIPMGGVVASAPQGIPTQTSQQVYHLPTSQPMMQPGIQSQPNLIPMQQTQYYTNSQIQGAVGVASLPNNVLQAQAQSNPNIPLQQTYSVTTINQQPQQMSMSHGIPPTSIPHISQSQISSTNVPVMMAQPTPLLGLNNLSIPSNQNTIISPQASSQGSTLVQQQYTTQPTVSSVGPTQSTGAPPNYIPSAVSAVPSVENVQVNPVESGNEQSTLNSTFDGVCDGTGIGGDEAQPVEDAER